MDARELHPDVLPLEATGSSNPKDKRILWLINHTTLREFEVPLLLSMGYEIFTPKSLPKLVADSSGTADFSFDPTLTIPEDALRQLNQHDFYLGFITKPIAAIINRYFGSAICVFYPRLLEQIVLHFEGRILIRAFGIDKDRSYSGLMKDHFDNNFRHRLESIKDRMWFSETYPNLHEVENELIQSRSIYHPIGIPESFFEQQDTYVGDIKKILFFCARINFAPEYYGKIYEEFKRHFHDLPHTIAGNQPVPVDDPNIAGYQSRSTINEWLQRYAVMFYHSQEPRHLHYHPLEAIIFGQPLVYMRGGILERFGGGHQPGACATVEEAKAKIKRILKGDEAFVAEIRKQQKKILEPFMYEYNRPIWDVNFTEKVIGTKTIAKMSKQKAFVLCLFLPIAYQGGTLNGAKNIAKMLHLGSRKAGEDINIVFSCPKGAYNIKEEFHDLLALGIEIRETVWRTHSREIISLMQEMTYLKSPLNNNAYIVPTDGKDNFYDCDFWLLISDRTSDPIAPIKPYGVMVYDYIQRYVPEIFPPSFDDSHYITTVRNADFVLTTTPQTREDAIQYGGVASNRVHLMPMEFSQLVKDWEAKAKRTPTILWASNASQHKNHLRALEALNIYFTEFEGKFNIVMTGVNTDCFDLHRTMTSFKPYVKRVRDLLHTLPAVQTHLSIKGNLSQQDYVSLLAASAFLWHPATYDNGTFSAIEAAYYGTPTLSSDYPQMQYINEKFNLALNFCTSSDARAMARQLKKMELECDEKRTLLPSKEFLHQFHYENLANTYWEDFRSLLWTE